MGVDAEMFVRTKKKVTEDVVRRKAFELASAFGSKNFMIHKEKDAWCGPRHCLEIVKVYEQDGPDIEPEPDETFIRVHLWTRYYGVGYERGDLPLILSVARWLEHHFPDSEIWYGGDSSGICAEEFDEMTRLFLWGHFCQDVQGYASHWNRGGDEVFCPFCKCHAQMMCNVWYGGDLPGATGWYCSGCDERAFRSGAGEVVFFKDEKELGKYVENLRNTSCKQ